MIDVPGDPQVLAAWLLNQQHPATTSWADPDTRRAALADDINDDLAMVTDRDLATWRRDRFAPEQPIDIMLNRWVAISDDLQAMLSMRYEDGDPDRPFVDAPVLNRAPATERDLNALADAATATYGALEPCYLRVWSSQPADTFPGTGPDKRFLAAPLEVLRTATLPSGLTARTTSDLSQYERAVAAYRAVDDAYPDHQRQAAIESIDALATTLEQGLLFDVLVEGTWSGYLAARPGGRLGLPGFTIQELILTPTARGHSLGRHLSPLLAQALPPTDGVLVGTIHQHNRGALRSAVGAGRIDIGGWLTIPLAQGPDHHR